MKPARLVVLGVALVAASVAALLVMRSPTPAPVVLETRVPVQTADILVASAELPRGQIIKSGDLTWKPWPVDSQPTGAIVRSGATDARDELQGSIVMSAFLPGEPLRRDKLVRSDGNAFMSAILPSGMRAVAISIDTRGANSAGGFILPSDRVDVIKTSRDEEGSRQGAGDLQKSETLLTNVKVLAIGQNVQEQKAGERVASGETATLEVTASQAELLALSQKVGLLSLALRSLSDAGRTETNPDEGSGGLTIVRYGVARAVTK